MCISTMDKPINTLTHLFKGFINKWWKEPVKMLGVRQFYRSSIQAEALENTAVVSYYSNLFHYRLTLTQMQFKILIKTT